MNEPKPTFAEVLEPAKHALRQAQNMLYLLQYQAAQLAEPDLASAVLAWVATHDALTALHASRTTTYDEAGDEWHAEWSNLVEAENRARGVVLALGRAIASVKQAAA